MSDIIRNETRHTINGVEGRLFTLRRPPAPWKAGTFANQTWKSFPRPVMGYGSNGQMSVEIQFDDNCKNGHNSFSITADVVTDESRRMRDIAAGGCMHDEIAAVFPELAPLIKWHLCSTDSPTHYVANTLYHASNRDHSGRAAGEPCRWEDRIYFDGAEVGHPIKNKFAEFIASRAGGAGEFQVVPIAYEKRPGETYDFKPKFTFLGYGEKWHECPFDAEYVAREWCEAVNRGEFKIKAIPVEFSKGKARDLAAARSCAVWPEATDDQLCAPREELKKALEDRLPALLVAMRHDIESAGFLWECPTE